MQFASMLYMELLIKKKESETGLTVSANFLGSGADIGISEQKSEKIFDIGAELDRLIQEAAGQKKKIMIGIDEVSKTPGMVVFASEFGKWRVFLRIRRSTNGVK